MASTQSTYTVERATTIEAPADRIYPHLVDFHAWSAWSPWEDIDPGMQRSHTGAASGPGARYAWSGNRKAGQGSMEITSVDEPRRVDIDLHFVKPFRSDNTIVFALDEATPGRTTVTWTMVGPRTLGTKVMGLFTSMDKLVGKDFEKGLSRLKGVAEGDQGPA